MAISLVSAPDQYTPAYNPIVFEFSSGNSSQCEFNYICDVYVNGTFATRLKTFPETNGNGIFRVDRILQDYLTQDFNPAITDFTPDPNSICSYYLELRERYNTNADCVGDVTLQALSYTSSVKYAFNAAFQYQTLGDFTQTSHILEDAASQPLTDMPDNLLIGLADNFQMSFLHDYKVDGMEVNTYDSSNNLIDTYKLTNTYANVASPAVTGHRHLSVGVGPRNINTTDFDNSPSQPIIDSTVKYYTVTFLATVSPSDPISITKRFQIDTRCSQFENFRLFWLNRLGGFDSYNFNLKHKRQVAVERNTYTKSLANDYTVGDRGTTVTSIKANEVYTITSNWMSEDTALWLEELFTSPEVNLFTNKLTPTDYDITGLQYNSGFLNIQIDSATVLANGTMFTYSATNTSSFGVSATGSGSITASLGGGIFKTDIPAPIDPGMSIISTGTLSAELYTNTFMPVILTSNTYDEKIKKNTKNINYSIDFVPSYKVNTQSQ